MMKKFVPLMMLVISVLFLSACSGDATKETTVDAVSAAAIDETLIAQGRMEPVNFMDQSFSVPGQVAQVMVKDGDTVEAGQVLARLERSPEAETALARAEQELLAAEQALRSMTKSAKANLADARLARIAAQQAHTEARERYDEEKTNENQALLDKAASDLVVAIDTLRTLDQNDGLDPDQLAAVEARVITARAGLASAQAAIDAMDLESTISGTIIDMTLRAGERVAGGAPVLTVADTSTWVLKTDNLTESEVVNVRVGQPVTITLDALPDKAMPGEVTHINTRYEEKRGDITFTVTAALKETDPMMRWGMTAAVQFDR